MSPRFGNAGRDRRDHLAQSIKASYRHRLFRNLELGRQRSCVGFNITEAATSGRSRCSKPMLISWHKEVKGVGVNFWSRLHRAGLLDGRFFPPRNHLEVQVAHFPVSLTTLTTHPLRFPTRFQRNQNIPQETKLGKGYDFLFLTQKHLRFLNTKEKQKQTNNNKK